MWNKEKDDYKKTKQKKLSKVAKLFLLSITAKNVSLLIIPTYDYQ